MKKGIWIDFRDTDLTILHVVSITGDEVRGHWCHSLSDPTDGFPSLCLSLEFLHDGEFVYSHLGSLLGGVAT